MSENLGNHRPNCREAQKNESFKRTPETSVIGAIEIALLKAFKLIINFSEYPLERLHVMLKKNLRKDKEDEHCEINCCWSSMNGPKKAWGDDKLEFR